ncbi:hypothetical protein HPB50_018760 [Hyalomma asiaticum]|uniref:Uncharacterized protein n=1 Tax=Hyalomma asiaticum TaxID=266040 RepID=A0ACB7S488_HYAAI|nr:hypothetical protein HPB50_018760 [Hyalomma asiaticum]
MASLVDAYLPYDAMCGSMDTTGYDYVPGSRAPEQQTYDLPRRDYQHNAFNQPHAKASSWEHYRGAKPRVW